MAHAQEAGRQRKMRLGRAYVCWKDTAKPSRHCISRTTHSYVILCSIRPTIFDTGKKKHRTLPGDWRIRQDITPMGPRDRAMRDDDGHSLGNFTSAVHYACGTPGRIFRHRHVCGADSTVRRRKLGALPGLYWGGAVVGVCAGERERRWCGADVGYADGSGPSDASRAYGPRDLSSV